MAKNIIIYMLIITNTIFGYIAYKANEKNKDIVTINESLKTSYENAKEYIKDKQKIKISSSPDKVNTPPKETFRYRIYLENGAEMKGDHIKVQGDSIIIGSKNSLTVTLNKMDISKIEKISNTSQKIMPLAIGE